MKVTNPLEMLRENDRGSASLLERTRDALPNTRLSSLISKKVSR